MTFEGNSWYWLDEQKLGSLPFRVHDRLNWLPREIRKPTASPFEYFTSSEAWEFIATKLEEGHLVEITTLRQPPVKRAYVMKIRLSENDPLLYVKLELGSGKIIGRSFHYTTKASKYEERTDGK